MLDLPPLPLPSNFPLTPPPPLSPLQVIAFICIIAAAVALDDLDNDELKALDRIDEGWEWEDTGKLARSACGFLIFLAIMVMILEGAIIAQRFLNFGIVERFNLIFIIAVGLLLYCYLLRGKLLKEKAFVEFAVFQSKRFLRNFCRQMPSLRNRELAAVVSLRNLYTKLRELSPLIVSHHIYTTCTFLSCFLIKWNLQTRDINKQELSLIVALEQHTQVFIFGSEFFVTIGVPLFAGE